MRGALSHFRIRREIRVCPDFLSDLHSQDAPPQSPSRGTHGAWSLRSGVKSRLPNRGTSQARGRVGRVGATFHWWTTSTARIGQEIMNFDSSHPRARPSAAFARAQGREPRLIDRLEQSLSIPADSPDQVVELMIRCTIAAVELVVGVDHAGVTASLDSEPFTVAPTDERVEEFDRTQYLLGDGPCLSASRTGRSVRMSVEQLGTRWPTLGIAARNAGLEGFLAIPLFNYDVPVGSLNLYSHSAVAETDRDRDLVVVIAEYLGAGLDAIATDHRLERAANALRRGIASRADIERAVGILMIRRDTDPQTALSELQASARRQSRDLLDVARQMIISADDERT